MPNTEPRHTEQHETAVLERLDKISAQLAELTALARGIYLNSSGARRPELVAFQRAQVDRVLHDPTYAAAAGAHRGAAGEPTP